jgi:hypothetical protein
VEGKRSYKLHKCSLQPPHSSRRRHSSAMASKDAPGVAYSQLHAPCSQHDLNPNPRTQGLSPRVSTSSSRLHGWFIVPGMMGTTDDITCSTLVGGGGIDLHAPLQAAPPPRLGASQPTHAHHLNTHKHRAQQRGVQHEQECVLKRRNLDYACPSLASSLLLRSVLLLLLLLVPRITSFPSPRTRHLIAGAQHHRPSRCSGSLAFVTLSIVPFRGQAKRGKQAGRHCFLPLLWIASSLPLTPPSCGKGQQPRPPAPS